MRKETVHNLKVARIILGGILTNIPLGVGYYYGNLSTYTDSYFIRSVGRENHMTGALWLMSTWTSLMSFGFILAGIISNRIGLRLTLLMGMLIVNAAVYTSFCTLQSSFWSLHITLGIMAGIGSGLSYATVLIYIATWVKHRTGLASAVVASAFGGGSFLSNVVSTIFINPQKIEADIFVGASKYFSQHEIINRVPYVFLLLGALTTGCHILAFPLMSDHPDVVTKSTKKKSTNNTSIKNKSTQNGNINTQSTEQYGAIDSVNISIKNSDHQEKLIAENIEAGQSNGSINFEAQTGLAGFTLLDALQTKTLYLLSISQALLMIGFIVENSVYKQFGVLYIHDDYFLTNIGVGISVIVFVTRIMWGMAADKFDIKYILIFVSSVHACLVSFWYFTAPVNEWLYLAWTLSIIGTQNASMIIYPLAVLKCFGRDHYMTIFGIVSAFGVISYYATPGLAQVLVTQLGWLWLFFFVSATSFLALILVLFLSNIPKL